MISVLLNFLDQRICLRLTQTLLHLLWEGFAVGLCALVLAWLCRTATARVRYGIHAVSLVLMAACVPITFVWTDAPDLPQTEQVASNNFEPASSTPSTVPEQTFSAPGANVGFETEPKPAVPFAAVGGDLPAAEPVLEPSEVATDAVAAASPSRFEYVLRAVAPYAACAYVLGVVAMLFRLGCALWGGHRLRRCAKPISDRQLLLQVRRQAARIGLRFVPIVAYCERIAIPVVAGMLRPVILLPAWLEAELDPEQLLVILAHEMAHIRRFDLLVNLLQRLLETALFFHPAVWYLSRQLSFERENCCDDAVVQAGYERVQYASTLVQLAELCASSRGPLRTSQLVTLAASGGGGSQLKRRITRLLSGEQRLRLTRADSMTLVLVAGLVAGTISGLWRHALAAPPKDAEAIATAASDDRSGGPAAGETGDNANAVDGKEAADDKAREVEFSGNVVDADGKPVAGAKIWLAARAIDPDDPAARGIVRQLARSDEQGRFSFRLAPVDTGATDAANWTHQVQVTAMAAGYGCDWLPLVVFEKNPVSSEARDAFQQWLENHKRLAPGRFASRTLKLRPEAGPVRGRLVDLEGQPLSNVSISIESIANLDSALLSQAFQQTSKDVFSKALHAWTSSSSITRSEWQALVPPVKTNENGEFSLPGLGRDQLAEVTFSSEAVAAERLFILGRETDTKHLPHNSGDAVYVGTRFTHAVGPAVPVSGVVTEFKSGKPITGATVLVERLFREDGPNAHNLWRRTKHIRTVTDDQGGYRLIGIPPGNGHVLNVIPPMSEPWLISRQEFSLDPAQKNATVNMQVFRGIWIDGRVTDAATGEPVAGDVDYLALQKNPNIPQRFGLQDGFIMGRFSINESGHYRVAGLPGPGVLLVRAFRAKTVYPLGAGAEKVDGYDPQRVFLPTTPVAFRFEEWHRIVQTDPPVDAQSHRVDLTLSAGASLVGRVVGPSGVAVAKLEAAGVVEKDGIFNDLKLKDGKFTVHNYDSAVPRNLFVKANGDSLVGYLHLEGAAPANLTVTLQPAVTVRGRLIETETDVEAVGYHLYCESTKQGKYRLDDVTTDENGRFELKGLLAGNVYTMDAGNPQYFYNGKNGFTIDLTNSKPGAVLELGDVTGKNAKSLMK